MLLQDVRGLLTKGLGQDVVSRQPAFERVRQGAGLLEDFLLHVVPILAALDGVGGEGGFPHRSRHWLAVPVENPHLITADLGQVPFLQEEEALGDGQEGEDVRGNEVFTEAQAYDQGAALAGGHQVVRVLGVDDPQGIGPLQGGYRGAYRLQQGLALGQLVVDGVGDDLGVRLGGEDMAIGLLGLTEEAMILDDAVVHQGAAVTTDVGVGVPLGGLAMGGPAGVGDAEFAGQGVLVHGLGQALDLAEGADAAKLARGGQDRHAGGVVAPVFQPAQSLQENGRYVPLSNAAHYATHGCCPLGPDYLGFLTGRVQWSMVFCGARVRVSLSAGASRPMTEPAPIVAPAPTLTGATKAVLDPMKAPSPIWVRCLLTPS